MKRYTPREYLLIDMANQWGNGIDKKTFPQRIAWAKSLKRPMSKVGFAKKPEQYAAAILALEKADKGEAIGHLVGLDAAASGLAIMGALSGCETTSRNCGTIGKKPNDIYTVLNKSIQKSVDVEVSRADSKYALMTYMYGSEATPKHVFGDSDELIAFYDSSAKVAPGAVYMLDELLKSWQPFALEHSWTMPDNFSVKIPVLVKKIGKIEIDELDHTTVRYSHYVNEGTEHGLSVAANAIHSVDGFLVRELTRRCNYDAQELLKAKEILNTPTKRAMRLSKYEELYWFQGFLSAACIPSILTNGCSDMSSGFKQAITELIDDILTYPPFEMLFVHDEYKCHPNHVNRVRETYIGLMGELADSAIGTAIISQIRNDPFYKFKKLSETLGDKLREGEYPIA